MIERTFGSIDTEASHAESNEGVGIGGETSTNLLSASVQTT